jgi:hypothetical protein
VTAAALRASFSRRLPRPVVAVALGILATLITRLALGSYNDRPVANRQSGAPAAITRVGTTAITPNQLPALARALGQTIYWAPSAPYATLALIRLSVGGVQLRYLPAGVPLKTPSAAYLVIGSYPLANAFAAVSNLARERGATIEHLAGGTVAVTRRSAPDSVYLAHPGSQVEVEVYDPSIAVARSIVRSGGLRAISG